MPSYTVNYDAYTWPESRTGKCPVCGKRVRRSRSFEETLNPYNQNKDGEVKTVAEIRESLKAKAAAWVPDFTHAGCEADE